MISFFFWECELGVEIRVDVLRWLMGKLVNERRRRSRGFEKVTHMSALWCFCLRVWKW